MTKLIAEMPVTIAFPFVLDALISLEPRVNPMFGCHAVYVGEKIVLILRKREDHVDDNGVWIATDSSHHESLRKLFPSMRKIFVLGGDVKETNWQNIPEEADDFEESVMKACELILKNDPRIGRIPKKKRKKS